MIYTIVVKYFLSLYMLEKVYQRGKKMRTQEITNSLYTAIFAAVFAIYLIISSGNLHADELHWTTNYQEAVAQSKKESKPLFLYFTGSDWCSWCKRMDKEILSTPDFIKLVGDKFVFVYIDFPEKKKLSDDIVKQNETLQDKFKIEGYPTIVILDPDQKEIAKLNYREGGGKTYAEYLLKILEEQKKFQNGMQNLNKLSSLRLQQLYEAAKSRARDDDAQKIMQVGLLQKDNLYFLKEEYRSLLSKRNFNEPEVQQVRQKLLAKDPDNKNHLRCEIAILDYEALSKNLSQMKTADTATKPLRDYITAYGSQDAEHQFRIEMIIAQTYHFKNQLKQAQMYAKASYKHAPDELKTTIAQTLVNIEQDMNATATADSLR
jgi:protein disulfide-isomerase